MGLNETPGAERVHIGFFGMRNAGKSSLVNRVTNQDMSLVSDVKGTTTDPVKKSMELLPLGPVTIVDTPGFDDEGALGEMRVARTKEVLRTCDIAILVTENETLSADEELLLSLIKKREIPYLTVHNKSDLSGENTGGKEGELYVSAKDGVGIEELKGAIAALAPKKKEIKLVADFVGGGDLVVLVIPIDTAAPKGRVILPQQMAIRDVLDAGGVSVVTGVETLGEVIKGAHRAPSLVITDSQVFGKVVNIVPEEIPLTSFSVLMARYKGFLDAAVSGAASIDTLEGGETILVSEGCTHHRQCEDIGTVKLPAWIKKYTGKDFNFEFSSGHGFPEDLSKYSLVIHCGACMLGDNEVKNRMEDAIAAGVPFTNYGTVIAHMNGILERSLRIIKK
ncbi:MAG: [Clostridia bacterium]|nr:[FeFe] hydrogenase H-cluster maturation GTPase HydF [Clostridia bacterium]